MTDDAAEATFREAVAREASLVRLGRALALSDRGSFHLLDVVTPRTLRAAVPTLVGAMECKELARVRVTLDEMSSRDRLTAVVFAALGATETAATPLLIDASAALPSEGDAWTWCLDRWNERRDRIATERTAPVVLAAPSWLVGQLAESAPDLWSVRGPSARVDVAPPPAIAMIDRVQALSIVAIEKGPVERPSLDEVREALSRLDMDPTRDPADVRGASLLVLREANHRHRAGDLTGALHFRHLAVLCLEVLFTATPDDEELRLFYAAALISLGELQLERESFDQALTNHSKASHLLNGIKFSEAGVGVSLLMIATTGLQVGNILLRLGDVDRARRLLLQGVDFLSPVLTLMSTRDMLAVAYLTLLIRIGVSGQEYPAALDAAQKLHRGITEGLGPSERNKAMAVLAEFHLDRGDFDRVNSLCRDALNATAGEGSSISIASCALRAGFPLAATCLLRAIVDRLVSKSPGVSAETYVLGAEIARALHGDALIKQYVALAQAALDDLQQRDPTSPRCARLLARFAEQRVAPTHD